MDDGFYEVDEVGEVGEVDEVLILHKTTNQRMISFCPFFLNR